MCQQTRESFAELPVAGELLPLGICSECWRQTPMTARAAIIAAYPLLLRANDTAHVLATVMRLAHLDAESR